MDHLPSPFSPLPLQTNLHNLNHSETSSPPSSRTTSPPSSPTSRKNPHYGPALYQHHPTSTPNDHEHHAHPHAVSILPCAVLRGRSSMMLLRRRPSAIDMALSEERSRCDGNAIERQGLDLMEPRPVGCGMGNGFERVRSVSGETLSSSGRGMGAGRGPSVTTGGPGSGSGLASASSVGAERDSRRVSGSVVNQPRFVMGGIFEVMEGRA